MAYELFGKVAVNVVLPAHKLCSGDVATTVETHPGRLGQKTGYSLEVFNAVGETIAVVTVRASRSNR